MSYLKESEEDQLFYVKYDSEENEILFYHNKELLRSYPGLLESEIRTDYAINIELVIFHFESGRNSKQVSPLNRRIHDSALYPLVYINRNLFNNNIIFDPELLRKSKSTLALPQMIGRINLTSQSNELEFNSDRTNFVENTLTKKIVKDLRTLNEEIQTKGSELKRELKSKHGGQLPTGKAIEVPEAEENKIKVAAILINRQLPSSYFIPSEQIDLEDYIYQVRNSRGEEVGKNNVEIAVDSTLVNNRILPSIEDVCEKVVSFRYRDEHTDLVLSEVVLRFERKNSNVAGEPKNKSIFTIESNSEYKIKEGVVSNLIYAIDKAYLTRSRGDYLPLVACSIRTIFECSANKLLKSKKQWFAKIAFGSSDKEAKKEFGNSSLLMDVFHVLILLKKNQPLVKTIADATGISFSTMNNLLILADFKNAVRLSNVGAHSSSSYLTKSKIEECADKCGLFAVICDVLINLDSSVASSFSVVKVDVDDFRQVLGA
ncbi:hypothetical protein QCD60_19310 [Pokkaliibacter sp. MBI-7]|uniref:hypothetical protein n=1 Tax=Pokkaliibacter sp. MBI-7 TaxID=3040600 RepID=UPI00244B3EEA|nr:hypothetical protein [Pokkaliibacter sp. MBI-7]MDH2430971.1 hypothetical protein [Pokkaliibacter sp. MBI-7]MDH2434697.1 hypothetical protein [Pokkaliibacter sp. MBI-7]